MSSPSGHDTGGRSHCAAQGVQPRGRRGIHRRKTNLRDPDRARRGTSPRRGADFLDLPVSTVMTSEVLTCRPAESVQSLMNTMTEQRIRHLPVVDDLGRLAGLVSIGDVVKSHITQIEFERDQLEGYVSHS